MISKIVGVLKLIPYDLIYRIIRINIIIKVKINPRIIDKRVNNLIKRNQLTYCFG